MNILNFTGCQIFIIGYHLSIIMGILGILGVILSAITSFLFTSPLPHLNLTFHILLYLYCFEPANISSVMTDEIDLSLNSSVMSDEFIFIMRLYACT